MTTTGEPPGVGARAASGVIWTAAQKWILRVTGFATIALLTRLLSPADFGTVALAMAVLPLVYVLADMGFATYVVQAEEADRTVLDTAFWYTTGMGIALGAVLAGAAQILAVLLRAPEIAALVVGLVPIIILVTVTTVPTALLRRRMAFRLLALQAVVAGLVSQAAAIIVALSGGGAWALIVQLFAYQAVASAFAWGAARWRPGRRFSRTEFRTMVAFGSNILGVELVALARLWAENLIVAATLGTTGLGYLNVAQRLVAVAQDVTAAAILPVSTVVFAQIRSSSLRLRAAYLRALGVMYVAVIPVMVLIAVAAPLLLRILFGDQWGASVGPAQALAVAGIMTLGAMLDHGLFYGTGRPGRWLLYAVAIDALTVLVTLVLAPSGLNAVALGFVAVALVATSVRWSMVARLVDTRWWTVALPFARGAVAAAGSAAAGLLVLRLTAGWPALAAVTCVGIAVLVAHVALALLVMRRDLRDLVVTVLSRLAPRRRRSSARGSSLRRAPADLTEGRVES
ncbi:MAG: lipopolysaccharide biosynthesis protein [Microbacterium sp.]|uniref:lipopolysaccharide biosynthesis protein n=1 Tax=Microbacterium sp. TaxID=51671 RepID=UPI00261A49D7|nr:lipopolysaccharide biosynthesis protein [Microbacterium sp.]MCX6502866.1 lipopolysaccharide biosynthesis protein [Microbacterium sp.]